MRARIPSYPQGPEIPSPRPSLVPDPHDPQPGWEPVTPIPGPSPAEPEPHEPPEIEPEETSRR